MAGTALSSLSSSHNPRSQRPHRIGALFCLWLLMWKPRLSESGIAVAVVDRAWDGWAIAGGSLVPGRGQAVGGGRWWGQPTLIGQELRGQPFFLHGTTCHLTFRTALSSLQSPPVFPAPAGWC